MVEVTLTVVLLAVAMTTVVQVLGWTATERRAIERRQWAIQEVANLMERLTAEPYDAVTADSARTMALSGSIAAKLPEPELTIDVAEARADAGQGQGQGRGEAKRLAIRLSWRNRAGLREAPVRLTAWIYPRRDAR
jgi:Tfp pilus assembly protein PilV